MNRAVFCSVLSVFVLAIQAEEVAPKVDARYVPERMDDFCWENEYCGMRAYGPKVSEPPPAGEGLVSSGIDVFNKAVPDVQMAETLLRGVREGVSYHRNNGRGFDNYKVSTGRGCGGIGRLDANGWSYQKNWRTQRVIEKTAEKAVFELGYEDFTLRGTVTTGSPFTRFEVLPKKAANGPGLTGPGLDVSAGRQHDGVLKVDLQRGFIANFEPETEGHVMTAIVLDPACGTARIASDDAGCLYLLQGGESFTYYAGSAWTGAGVYRTADAWFAVVKAFAGKLAASEPGEDVAPVVPSERGRPAAAAVDESLDWIDGATLPIEGKPFAEADTVFARLPTSAKSFVVPGTWAMGHCTAGMSYVFRTDSSKLKIRWDLNSTCLQMRNMSRAGVSGIDLYEQQADGTWRFIKVGIPKDQKDSVFEVPVRPMKKLYRVYLPLYNGLTKIEFGVEKGKKIYPVPLAEVGRGGRPVVFYGGSVVQGASASRPGMHWVNICGRFLGRPTTCMGFNGQGRMNIPEEADLLAKTDASAYCFLCLGNMGQPTWKEDAEAFLTRLHRQRPDVPIVFGGFHYIHQQTDEKWTFAEKLERKLKAQDPVFWKNLSVIPAADVCPADYDGTVDGGHPNDWGAMHMAKAFAAAIEKALAR